MIGWERGSNEKSKLSISKSEGKGCCLLLWLVLVTDHSATFIYLTYTLSAHNFEG